MGKGEREGEYLKCSNGAFFIGFSWFILYVLNYNYRFIDNLVCGLNVLGGLLAFLSKLHFLEEDLALAFFSHIIRLETMPDKVSLNFSTQIIINGLAFRQDPPEVLLSKYAGGPSNIGVVVGHGEDDASSICNFEVS